VKLSAKDVASLALKRAPTRKWCYLWVQPVNNTRNFQAFSLIPPFSQKEWVCVGKIQGIKAAKNTNIEYLADRIIWTLEMHKSFNYAEPNPS